MALTGSGQISMGDTAGTNRRIFQEKTGLTQSTVQAQNISLRGLSVDGIADYQDEDGDDVDVTGTPDGSTPYKMSEFHGYSQSFSTNFTGYTTNSGGKANITRYRTNLTSSTAVMSDGTFTITVESARGTNAGLRIIWGSSSVSTGWTSVTITHSAGAPNQGSSYTVNRSAMSTSVISGQYSHQLLNNHTDFYLSGDNSAGNITFND